MAGGGTPNARLSTSLTDELARREEARAAEERMQDNVLRTARPFKPLLLVAVIGIDNPSSDVVVLPSLIVIEVEMREASRALLFESVCRRCLTDAGIAPPGNDDDTRIGSLLAGGHIAVPRT